MRIVNIEQGTQEWLDTRKGLVTGSRFKDVITPAKAELSKSSKMYMYELVAERMGATVNFYQNEHMQRGNELEPDARTAYEFVKDAVVEQVGICIHDNEMVGVSPDGLIGEDGGLEIKCPKETTHISYLDSGEMPLIYKPQVQGSMWVTGRKWWDFMSYHPDLPPLIVRVFRDEDYIISMEAGITKFAEEVLDLEKRLIKKYIGG
jgi:putative phage-type endonuclease